MAVKRKTMAELTELSEESWLCQKSFYHSQLLSSHRYAVSAVKIPCSQPTHCLWIIAYWSQQVSTSSSAHSDQWPLHSSFTVSGSFHSIPGITWAYHAPSTAPQSSGLSSKDSQYSQNRFQCGIQNKESWSHIMHSAGGATPAGSAADTD